MHQLHIDPDHYSNHETTIPNWLLTGSDLSAPARIVYFFFLSHGGLPPRPNSPQDIAVELRLPASAVFKALGELAQAELIDWKPTGIEDGA